MTSAVMPSDRYSCSGSDDRLTKGSTATAGRPDGVAAGTSPDSTAATGAGASSRGSLASVSARSRRTSPPNRKPFLCTVRM